MAKKKKARNKRSSKIETSPTGLAALLERLDCSITQYLACWSIPALQASLGIVFIWFGILKPLGISPAIDLVTRTVYWVDPSWFIPFLGWWEVVIGICLLWRPLIRVGIFLMACQMFGTFLPLVLLPHITWQGVLIPTLEGQYIIKNLVLIAAALMIGSKVRDKTCRMI